MGLDSQSLYILTWVIAGVSIVISLIVQLVFRRFSNIPNSLGLNGADLVYKLNKLSGLSIRVQQGTGWSSDFFDPKTDAITLSRSVFLNKSITALGVAAHEYGHALQKANKYPFLVLRSLIVPVVNIGTNLGTWLFFIGLILGNFQLAMLGIILFSGVTLFTLITLPVEFNASHRAMVLLRSLNLPQDELDKIRSILFWAALTYVAGFASALVNLLYMVSLLENRRK